jgi:hypothetical protein
MQERELWQNRFNPLGISKFPLGVGGTSSG